MNWLIIYEIIYVLVVVLVCLRIVYDTRTNAKTLAYLLLVILIPIIGIIFYFSFGINYRKREMYSKKLIKDDNLFKQLKYEMFQYSNNTFEENKSEVRNGKELIMMLLRDGLSPLTGNNHVKLLVNGEHKFPEVLKSLKEAKNHIHIEYYIYEDDEIGKAIEEILIQKAKEGVIVRFIYDDFGSRSIRKKLVKRLKEGGVNLFPFSKIIFIAFANRINYRNHRKIIVVDGKTAFVGGINVSDRYINHPEDTHKLYWRDTHLRIDGPGVRYLQYLFMCDWNFCANEHLQPNDDYFPPEKEIPVRDNKVVQIAASGPDSERPVIMFSLLQAINLAKKEIFISTPYFIPGESLKDALIVAALGGISVKLLVPGVSDSRLVDYAARSYYDSLLQAGVEIYLYKKGFMHAKTMVSDRSIAIVGTANMDQRSFDLNFEVNAVVYDSEIASELTEIFFEDLKNADKVHLTEWKNRPWPRLLLEQAARIISPLL